MQIRQAKVSELNFLREQIEGEQIELETSRVWVAVEDGKILGFMPARLVWQFEPLMILPCVKNTHKRRRIGISLYTAAVKWLGSPENRTGIHWTFGITRKRCVGSWLKKLGWFRQYKGAATYLKYVRE